MMIELESCPFCDGRASYAYGTYMHRNYDSFLSALEASEKPQINGTKFVEVYCTVCQARIRREGPLWESEPGYEALEAEVAEAWNRRSNKTAEITAVKHGRWYMRGGRPCCSECDTQALWKEEGATGGFKYEIVGAKSKFCPECGAKMDKKEET